MGGSSSDSGGSSNLESLRSRDRAMAEATNRAKAEQEAKSRQSSFDDYQQQRSAASQGIDVMISPQKAKTVRENAGLAMMLDERAKTSQIKVPIPTLGTVAMGTISSISSKQQARALRSGGIPVYDSSSSMFDADKDYRGVVKDGRFSGDPSFSPIGRSEGVTRTESGSYSVSAKSDDGGNDSPTEEIISPSPKDMTTPKPKAPSISTASRRALISGAGGGALRRNLL
tara:strand:+ start:11926 stop:12609 length:684 start_codon:yes stop_codon:yes gene_type:complete